jgi:hypothetical protein
MAYSVIQDGIWNTLILRDSVDWKAKGLPCSTRMPSLAEARTIMTCRAYSGIARRLANRAKACQPKFPSDYMQESQNVHMLV